MGLPGYLMTRRELRNIISMAHDALHNGDIEKTHDILHEAYSTEPEHDCMSADPEVVQAVKRFDEMAEGKLPCGHITGDLIWAPGSITKCGACISSSSNHS
jgi:hypothetical protein